MTDRYGLIFVSYAVDIPAIQSKTEGRALYSSILNYMKSDNFNPSTQLSMESEMWKSWCFE